jgi:hypothetical protein
MDACCPISTFGGGSGPFVLAIIFTRRKVYQNSHSDVESPPLHKSQISLRPAQQRWEKVVVWGGGTPGGCIRRG